MPVEDNRNFWKRSIRQAWQKIVQTGWPGKSVPADPPGGLKLAWGSPVSRSSRKNW